ncbi:TPA: hypothetical protein DCQ44_02685, partial [Candidatus Taylorbacteria bacterium]|nr:hypothetical protein [Candidatus Taylorbacteria bacterium]
MKKIVIGYLLVLISLIIVTDANIYNRSGFNFFNNKDQTASMLLAQATSLTAHCSAGVSSVPVGTNVTYTPWGVSGGTGSYTYSWTGTDGLSGISSWGGIGKIYSTAGTKTAILTVTSGTAFVSATCGVTVTAPTTATPAPAVQTVTPATTQTSVTSPTPVPAATPTVTATIVGSKNPVGTIDSVSCTSIAGWAYDPDNTAASVRIDVYRDGIYGTGTYVTSFTANTSRPDVNTYYGAGSNHGYSFALPTPFKDGKDHKLYIYGINVAGTGGVSALITGSPKIINCAGAVVPPITSTLTPTVPAPIPAPISAPAPVSSPMPIVGNKNPIGYFDSADCSVIKGWAYDADNKVGAISVDVYRDGKYGIGTYITSLIANQSRPDVNTAYG